MLSEHLSLWVSKETKGPSYPEDIDVSGWAAEYKFQNGLSKFKRQRKPWEKESRKGRRRLRMVRESFAGGTRP